MPTEIVKKMDWMRRASITLMATMLLCLVIPTIAQGEVRRKAGLSMQSAGMGDATRATSVGHNALIHNPSGMSQVKAYQVTTGFGYSHLDLQASPTISFVDSLLNPMLAAGVGYTFRAASGYQGDGDRRREHHTRGAISTGYSGQALGFYLGAGLNWLNMGVESGEADDFVAMDTSVTLVVLQTVRLAVVGHNLFPFTDMDPKGDMPRSLGTGVAANFGQFLLEFDTDTDFDTYSKPIASYHIGGQVLVIPTLPLRFGYAADPGEEAHRLSGGIGYWTPQFMVDIGYQHNVQQSGDFTLGLDLVFALN